MGKSTPSTMYKTLGDLPLHDFQVSPNTIGSVIAKQFEQRPDLPGVIIADDAKMLGVISRRRFHEQMSMPYSQEIFLSRPIRLLANLELSRGKGHPLELPDTEPIDAAVRSALDRPKDEVYEPVIVVFRDSSLPEFQVHFLLDLHTLLLAQTQMLAAINQEMHQQRTKLEQQQQRIAQETQKVGEYTRLLENHQAIIQERNMLLETQQIEILDQAREIAEFNKRFMKIARLLSQEGKKAFQATFAGVNAICHNTNQIVSIGKMLTDEMNTLHETSELIARVSQQVRHLSVQAAIVANHSGTEMAGFSHITAEIGKLVNQTLEAGKRMERLASRFKTRIQDLTDSAHGGTTVAQSLAKKIEQAQYALAELEALVRQEDGLSPAEIVSGASAAQNRAIATQNGSANGNGHEGISPSSASTPEEVAKAAQSLIQKIAMAEATVSDLEDFIRKRDSESLVRKIKRTLDHNRRNLTS
jgi:methyl-accepting chemotaxis protein